MPGCEDFFPNYIPRSTENVSMSTTKGIKKVAGKINKRMLCLEYRIVFQKTYDEAVEKTLRKRIFQRLISISHSSQKHTHQKIILDIFSERSWRLMLKR